MASIIFVYDFFGILVFLVLSRVVAAIRVIVCFLVFSEPIFYIFS